MADFALLESSKLISRKICVVDLCDFFYVIQFLREIKDDKSSVSKSAILTHLEALNFDFYEFLYFFKAPSIYKTNKIQSP